MQNKDARTDNKNGREVHNVDGPHANNSAADRTSVLNDADLKYANSVGSVAAPVLAGFSFATVVMVSVDASKYRWADAAILSLAIAAVAILVAVQCSKYVNREYPNYARWYGGLLISYHLGLVAMMLGLGFALGPLHVQGSPSAPRWAACIIAWLISLGEFIAFCSGKRSLPNGFAILFKRSMSSVQRPPGPQ
jgi:MFS family permease